MVKDKLEFSEEPNLKLNPFLENAYTQSNDFCCWTNHNPMFKAAYSPGNKIVVEEPTHDRALESAPFFFNELYFLQVFVEKCFANLLCFYHIDLFKSQVNNVMYYI